MATLLDFAIKFQIFGECFIRIFCSITSLESNFSNHYCGTQIIPIPNISCVTFEYYLVMCDLVLIIIIVIYEFCNVELLQRTADLGSSYILHRYL